MRILIVGNGGREHALAWALARSPKAPELFIAPGNPGTAQLGRNVDIGSSQIDELLRFAKSEQIDLTVVGPEQPLVDGLVDAFEAAGLAVMGPSAAAARLEGSKAFAKAFMDRHGIPTAAYRAFRSEDYEAARDYLKMVGAPVVLKASGLAAGKGAVVCETLADAEEVLRSMLVEDAFGSAGREVVIEEFMRGEEVSVFALTDGAHYILLPPAQDHKRVGEGDTGPNTGGMGAYAPAPIATPALLQRICREIIEPTIAGMAGEGYPYKGVLYCGLMITEDGPKVVEYNCRFGDPEAQVLLPLLDTDLVSLFQRLVEGRLQEVAIRTRAGAAACVVAASEGYPGSYPSGRPIYGLDQASELEDVVIFQAGTKPGGETGVVTAGGRVLGVTGIGDELSDALDRAYKALDRIHFDGIHFRRDIGWRGLERLASS